MLLLDEPHPAARSFHLTPFTQMSALKVRSHSPIQPEQGGIRTDFTPHNPHWPVVEVPQDIDADMCVHGCLEDIEACVCVARQNGNSAQRLFAFAQVFEA